MCSEDLLKLSFKLQKPVQQLFKLLEMTNGLVIINVELGSSLETNQYHQWNLSHPSSLDILDHNDLEDNL